MGDVSGTRPSNVRPRPLGEVKAENVYFDPTFAHVWCIEPSERPTIQQGSYRMNSLHDNLITTALIGDVAAANSVPSPRKQSTANGLANGTGANAMQVISSLVTPHSRTISIPQPRANNTHGPLRINTAPSGFNKDKSMSDPCPSPVSTESSTTMSSRSTKSSSPWGEYKRQISTAKRREMCRRISELSKCDLVDMNDPLPREGTSPAMILSRMPQREKEYDELMTKADTMLQRKKTLPSVFMTKQKRPGLLVKDMNVFSKAMKNKHGLQIGKMDDMVVGKSVDPNHTDRQDGVANDTNSENGSLYNNKHSHCDMNTSRSEYYDLPSSRQNSRLYQPNPSQLGPQKSRYRDKVLKLQGKSLPRINTFESKESIPKPSETSRSVPNTHDARVLRDLNTKCDRLQKKISISLISPDRVWSQHGYFNTHQPAPVTGPVIPQRKKREPIHAIYRSFQRMQEHRVQTTSPKPKPEPESDFHVADSLSDQDIMSDRHSDDSDRMKDIPGPELELEEDENNNIQSKTFHLTQLEESDFSDSDAEDDPQVPSFDDEMPVTLLKLGDSDPTKQTSGEAKYQGPTTRISEEESGSQFHVVNGENNVNHREVYKVLKALDKDVYGEYEHRKYRRSGTLGSFGNPDNPRVHFLKVKVNNTETSEST